MFSLLALTIYLFETRNERTREPVSLDYNAPVDEGVCLLEQQIREPCFSLEGIAIMSAAQQNRHPALEL